MNYPRGLALALFLSLFLGGVSAAAEPFRTIVDAEVAVEWKKQKIQPARPSSDSEFLRRIYLDLVGVIPSADEATAFLDSKAQDKRAGLIDQLLADPRHARHQADLWDMIFFGRNPAGNESQNRAGFQNWLRKQFEQNVPFDIWARELLRAEATTADSGSHYYVQYRNAPEDAIEAITQTFLGVQLQCARCHDHPYEEWKQVDFYGMAAFLARVEVVPLPPKESQPTFAIGEKNSGDIRFTGPAKDAKPGNKGEAVKPKFLHGEALAEPELPKDYKEAKFAEKQVPPKPKFSRKDALADWITKPTNPYFARAVANRVWSQLMGRGLVHPVDNMSNSNKASHPVLLDTMTREFIDHKFDMKWLIREIVNSQTYQLSTRGGKGDAYPDRYQHARSRPLSAEELVESWQVATGYSHNESASAKTPRVDRFRPLGRDYLIQFFGSPNNGTGDFQGGIREHLYLNNGPLGTMINTKGGLAEFVGDARQPMATRIERLFLATLSRRPADDEIKKFTEFLGSGGSAADAVWTLMTCAEFRFNH